MKRSKKYEKIKSKKANRELVIECDRLINEILELGEISIDNLFIVLGIRMGKKKEELNIVKMSDKDLEKLKKELKYIL
jgi:hypothetical protein